MFAWQINTGRSSTNRVNECEIPDTVAMSRIAVSMLPDRQPEPPASPVPIGVNPRRLMKELVDQIIAFQVCEPPSQMTVVADQQKVGIFEPAASLEFTDHLAD
jgi:hypothetical protein